MRIATLLLITLLSSNSSHAFEVSENFWETGQAVFHVGISGSSPTGGTWNDAFKRSMAAWSDVSVFDFVALDDYIDPCISRGEGLFGDESTGVDFGATVCGSEFGENTLAITLTAGQCLNPQCTGGFSITDADIIFNSSETWDVYTGPLRFDGTSEFERVALHELGHALGLNHSNENSAIMRAFVSDTSSLQSDDIAGVSSIYGGIDVVQETTIANIYGVTLVAPDNAIISGPNNSNNLSGTLSSSDNQLDGKSLDLYQYTFENDSLIDIQLDSQAFDPFLYLVRVSATQASIPSFTFVDDNSGPSNNARITENIQAGTYWLGVSSASNNGQGSYEVAIISNTRNPPSSFETFTSVYGVDVLVNPNSNIDGSLSSTDFKFNDKFLDLVQIEVLTTSTVKVELSSSAFDTSLLLVDIINNEVGSLALQNDDGGSGTNSRLDTTLSPGTYWLGITSFNASESGDYDIAITLVIP
ncbi:MAG: matrixin family metalloprotease [Gammaproteobacteria bacterium]|nr:matrixin family metalloprotease [Gammaproteobacteria bacterium]